MRRAFEFGPAFCLHSQKADERDVWLYLANRFRRQHAGCKTGMLAAVAILAAEGDKIVARASDRFTDQGDGKQVALTRIEILRLDSGQGSRPEPGPT